MARISKNAVITIVVASIVVTYSLFRFIPFLKGPEISISSPENGATVSEELLSITGIAKQIAFITVNDRSTFIDENGNIFEQLLLQSGYNIISIKATDRFGRKVEKRLEIVYKPLN